MSGQPFAVEVDNAACCVRVAIGGDLDTETLRRVTDAMLDAHRASGYFTVLVDLGAIAATPPPSAIQRLPEYYAQRGADPRLTLAVVLPPRGDRLDLSRFYRLAARRHSFRVAIFDSVEPAMRWLDEQRAQR